MWTRSDLYSVLGTSNIFQAYYRSMSAVLHIYILNVCTDTDCVYFVWVSEMHTSLLYSTHTIAGDTRYALVQKVSLHGIPCV